MSVPQFEDVAKITSAALADWNSFAEILYAIDGPGGAIFHSEIPIPNVPLATTIEQVGTKLAGTNGLARDLENVESADLIPDQAIIDLTARASAVRSAVEKLLAQVTQFDPESKVTALDPAGMSATNEAGQQIGLLPPFAELYQALQSFLSSVYQMRAMTGLSGTDGFAVELAQIAAARSAQRKAYADVGRLKRVMKANVQKMNETLESANAAAQHVTVAGKNADEGAQKAAEAKSKADALLASAQEIEAAANKLKSSVDDYQKAFAKFQADLDTRNVAFVKGSEDIQKLLKENTQRHEEMLAKESASYEALMEKIGATQSEIERLLSRSRDVLGEATVSGLSDSFAREMSETKSQLRRIQWLFYASVAFLLIMAGAVLDAFPWLGWLVHITKLDPPNGGEWTAFTVYILANFLRTLTFLLAPLVLLFYAARRYTELFRLKAQYTYKYTVAASLPGFKLEAPTYAEAITASAFKELLFNPGESVGLPEDASNEGNTFLQRLIEPVVKKLLDKMGEVPK